MASGSKPRILIDLYCGVGLFGIAASSRFDKVVGIEVVQPAITLAKQNCLANNVTNASFHCLPVEKLLDELSDSDPSDQTFTEFEIDGTYSTVSQRGPQTAIIVDPPRRGLTKTARKYLLEVRPARIVYVSCDPTTQARDISSLLARSTYKLKSVTAFDMFPQTRHLESVAVLEEVTDHWHCAGT
eukprot:TRINITY_DN30038_c0_g1_i1.p2 TRINITY_DN30038_c0_g1~~TRINITY_DN30038_c0_g1_i1.p2  ORF type:complete len:185 (+),score=17.86 TRINITY_DN30038_c0_g1_i1:190-744(+)